MDQGLFIYFSLFLPACLPPAVPKSQKKKRQNNRLKTTIFTSPLGALLLCSANPMTQTVPNIITKYWENKNIEYHLN